MFFIVVKMLENQKNTNYIFFLILKNLFFRNKYPLFCKKKGFFFFFLQKAVLYLQSNCLGSSSNNAV
jgi:hypothetical protein